MKESRGLRRKIDSLSKGSSDLFPDVSKKCFCAMELAQSPHCADEGGLCTCPNGRVFYGPRDYGNSRATFEQMKSTSFRTATVGPSGTLSCSTRAFGGDDPATGRAKQCFCEPDYKDEPFRCSEDGGTCQCKNGNVFYGR